jgi:hypothetical protein
VIAIKARLGWQLAFVGSAVVGLVWVPIWLLATRSAAARAALGGEGSSPSPPPSPITSTGGGGISRAQVFATPAVLRAVLLTLMSSPAMMFVLIWFPQFLEHAHGVIEDDVGKYTTLPALGFALGAVVVGASASALDRGKREGAPVAQHGALVAIAGVLTCALVLVPLAPTPWTAVALSAVATFGGGALFSRLTTDMLARTDPAHTSMAGGFTAAAQSLAYVAANPLVGKAVDLSHSYTSSIVVLGLLPIPGVLAWLLWPMRAKPPT